MNTIKTITAMLLLALLYTNAYAYDFEVDGVYYNLVSANDKTCEVVGAKEGLTSLTIPSSITTRGVELSIVRICTGSFKQNESITRLIVNAPIEIQSSAFYGCTHLTQVSLGNGVKSIEEKAFYNCPIDSLFVPNTVNTIGANAINLIKTVHLEDGENELICGGEATSMINLYMGRNMKTGAGIEPILRDGNIYWPDCYKRSKSLCGYNLLKVSIGNMVRKLDESLFENCRISSISIPKNIVKIGPNVFKGCTKLRHVFFEDSETAISIYYNYDHNPLLVESGTSPFPVKGVCSPFQKLPLTSVYIGRDISYVTYSYFLLPGKWGYLTLAPPSDAIGLFNHTTLEKVDFGPMVTNICEYMFKDCKNPNILSIPNSVRSIDEHAFYKSAISGDLKSKNLISIGDEAFYGCERLKSIDFESLQKLGEAVFLKCSSLRKVDLRRIKTLPSETFKDCTSLNWVSFGEDLTLLRSSAFSHCSNLTQIGVKALTPPEIPGDQYPNIDIGFHDINKYEATLYIPVGTTAKYEDAYSWRTFLVKLEQDIPEFKFVAKKPKDIEGDFISVQPTNKHRKVSLTTIDPNAKYQWYKYVEKAGKEIDITNLYCNASGWGLNNNGWCTNTHNADSAAILNYDLRFNTGDKLSFDWSVSSEAVYDQLQCYLGDELLFVKSGDQNGHFSKTFESATTGKLSFVYIKDNFVDVADDNAVIRNIKLANSENMTMQIPEPIVEETKSELSNGATNYGDRVFCVVTLGNGMQIKSDEFVLEYLNFIKTQPTEENPCVILDTPDSGAKYQWYQIADSYSQKITPTSTGPYAWTENDGVWISNNKTIDASSSVMSASINVMAGDTLNFDWSVSSEAAYDYFTCVINGTQVLNKSGIDSGTFEKTFTDASSVLIEFKYTKDRSGKGGKDCATVSNIRLARHVPVPENYKIEGATANVLDKSLIKKERLVFCLVTLSDGRTLTSNTILVHPKSDIKDIEINPSNDYDVYNINGAYIMKCKDKSELGLLPSGIYIVNGKKVFIK